MSLKDEIQKLINERLRVLRADDLEARDSYLIAKSRFKEIQPLLAELGEAADKEFVRVKLTDDEPQIYASIYCADWENAREDRPCGCLWKITPLSDFDGNPSWNIEGGNLGIGDESRSHSFDTAAELFAYLIPELAVEIAHLKHNRAE